MADVLQTLRRHDFPHCARMAMEKLDSFLSPGSSGIPGIGGACEEVADQIVQEFVFCQISKSGQAKKLNSIQELQILDVLLDFFTKSSDESTQHSVFKVLFEHSSSDPFRMNILCKLASMAVGVGCKNVLQSTAIWMQKQGCSSDAVCKVGQNIVQDYCVLVPCACPNLLALATTSEHFTCNFITSVTAAYQPQGSRKMGKKIQLPLELLKVLTEWIEKNPTLCLISMSQAHNSFIQPQRSSLWTSPTKPNTQTPIPGLVRWCTQAPILLAMEKDNTNSNPTVHKKNTIESTSHNSEWIALWSRLHLAVLQTLVAFPSILGAAQLELITLADMSRIVKEVCALIKDIKNPMDLDYVQVAIDRLVQILQVSLATGGFRCSLIDLQNICQQIPRNKLLDILESQHLSRAPPQMHHDPRR